VDLLNFFSKRVFTADTEACREFPGSKSTVIFPLKISQKELNTGVGAQQSVNTWV
jgi:hypothetical protein